MRSPKTKPKRKVPRHSVINGGFGPYWLLKLGMYNAHFSGVPQFLEWDQEIFSVFVLIQHISHLPSIGPGRYRSHSFSIFFAGIAEDLSENLGIIMISTELWIFSTHKGKFLPYLLARIK